MPGQGTAGSTSRAVSELFGGNTEGIASGSYPHLEDEQMLILAHTDAAYCLPPDPETLPLDNAPRQPIVGGAWQAVLFSGEVQITVHFIQANGEYIGRYQQIIKRIARPVMQVRRCVTYF